MFKAWLSRLLSGTIPEDAAKDPSTFFSSLPRIETDDLILRPVQMRDARDIYAYASDPEVARYVLWDPHRSLAETKEYIRYIRGLYRRGLPSSWAAELRSESRVIGTIGFMYYAPPHGTCEIGYSFSRNYWNCGYATQALTAVIRCAFDHLPDLCRIEAQHDIRNPASGRVMQKSGMLREGILRSRLYNKNEHIDVALYAIVREDWNP